MIIEQQIKAELEKSHKVAVYDQDPCQVRAWLNAHIKDIACFVEGNLVWIISLKNVDY
jgi:hypothetical protein